MTRPLLEFNGISKRFFGVEVLHGVSFQVQASQALGLVGENGAGKSTLMNILGGNLRPNAGEMRIDGQPYSPDTPRKAEQVGIAFIHQELNLFSNLTVAENLSISNFPRKLGIIQRRRMLDRAREFLRQVGLAKSPQTLVESLSPGERQLVEIAKALSLDAKLIILDEPTTSLTSPETERLFELLDRLRDQGMAFIYISHALADVLRLCERVVVLRDGSVVDEAPARELDEPRLISRMVGREIDQLYPPRLTQPGEQAIFEVEGVYRAGVIRHISFKIRCGEVVGLAGLMGSGRTELARLLFGLDRLDAGEIKLDDMSIENLSTRRRVALGLALLTESRRTDGLCMAASIWDNISLPSGPRFARSPLGWFSSRRQQAAINEMGGKVHLTRPVNFGRPVRTLSGGNQQKVVLGKWLLNDPRVMILDEPTRGIDVGAKFEVYTLINELAGNGSGVLMISSEIEELIGMCDRMLIMNEGAILGEYSSAEFEREKILSTMMRATG